MQEGTQPSGETGGNPAPGLSQEQIAQIIAKVNEAKEPWYSRIKWPKFSFRLTQNHTNALILIASGIGVRLGLFSTNPQVVKIGNILIGIGLYHILLTLDDIFFRSRGFDTDAHITEHPLGVVLRRGFYGLGLAILLGLIIGGMGV